MTPIPSTPVQAQRGTDERDDPFTVAELRSAFNRMFDLWAAVEIEKHQLEQQLRARDEEIAALRKDAERYRALRAPDSYKFVRILFLKEGRWYQSDAGCYLDNNVDANRLAAIR